MTYGGKVNIEVKVQSADREQITAINAKSNAPKLFSHFYQPNERHYSNNFQSTRGREIISNNQ